MPAAIKTTVSLGTTKAAFFNTPQAKDDLFRAYGESTTGFQLLDVMGNDGGGNAASLWSLDDGLAATGITQLLTQSSTGFSTLGRKITISNGKVSYDFGTGFDCLAEGEHFVDTFTYAIRMANGTVSWATATVDITGTNDAAIITGDVTGTATEDGAAIGGKLLALDVDNGDNGFQANSLTGAYGSFTIDDAGNWSYQASDESLKDGEEATEEFEVKSADGTTKTITITVQGSDDAATFGGDETGTAAEDGAAIGGTLTMADKDAGDNGFQADSQAGDYGSFTIDDAGNWSYQASDESLKDGDEATEEFEVKSADGTTKTITITVQGSDDAATFGGDETGTAAEDGAAIGGTLTMADKDAGDNGFQANSLTGAYGSFTIDDAGNWSYQASDESLKDGEEATEEFEVKSADGTTKTITITVQGSDDAATFGGTSTGSVTEDTGPATASGSVTVSDLDAGQSGFTTGNGEVAGLYGTWTFSGTGDTKAWSYAPDNANTEVEALSSGDKLTETLDLYSTDGTRQALEVVINGNTDITNLAPTVAGERIILSNSTNQNPALLPFSVFLANDSDADGQPLTITSASTTATGMTVSATTNPGFLTFTLQSGVTGNADGKAFFSYTVSDGAGGTSIGTIEAIILNVANNAQDNWSLQQFTPYAASYLDAQSASDTITGATNLDGGMGKDWLFGGAAADRLSGGAGTDVMTGGVASDVFVFAKGFGADIVTDFTRQGGEADALDLDVTFAQTTRTQVGADTVITSGLWNAGESLTLLGVTASGLQAAWFV